MKERLMEILNQICGTEDGELEQDLDLFEAGLLDSFGVVQLLVEIEEKLHIVLDVASLNRQEIATPALLAERIRREGSR